MQIVRFYGVEQDGISVLAKFVKTDDSPEQKIIEYAQFVAQGIDAAGNVVDFLNGKFIDLSEIMQDHGFIPEPVLELVGKDHLCEKTYDIAIDVETRVVNLLIFRTQNMDVPPYYDKVLADQKTYGHIS